MVGYGFSLVTIVLAIGAIIGTEANHQPFDTTLGICLGWAIYAAIAPCLVLTYVFWHSIGFHRVASWILRVGVTIAIPLSAAAMAFTLVMVWWVAFNRPATSHGGYLEQGWSGWVHSVKR